MVFLYIILAFLIILGGLLIPRLIIELYSASRISTFADAPHKPIGIIFGAGLWKDGSPTPVLRDRVTTGAQLYFAGKITKLLMSGDNSTIDYNEPEAMRLYALKLGIPEGDIILDYAGRRTYDTCFRAKHIFGIDEALLITQNFHLPRAVYICNRLGISGIGVSADILEYRFLWRLIWHIRELPAAFAALWEVNVSHPKPVMGQPEPIIFEENQ